MASVLGYAHMKGDPQQTGGMREGTLASSPRLVNDTEV